MLPKTVIFAKSEKSNDFHQMLLPIFMDTLKSITQVILKNRPCLHEAANCYNWILSNIEVSIQKSCFQARSQYLTIFLCPIKIYASKFDCQLYMVLLSFNRVSLYNSVRDSISGMIEFVWCIYQTILKHFLLSCNYEHFLTLGFA